MLVSIGLLKCVDVKHEVCKYFTLKFKACQLDSLYKAGVVIRPDKRGKVLLAAIEASEIKCIVCIYSLRKICINLLGKH